MRVQNLIGIGLSGLLLVGCAVIKPDTTGVVATSPSPTVTASETPTPSPSPTPEPEPTERVKGSNHSHDAARYAFPAKDVHEWLVKGEDADNYPSYMVAFLTFDDGPNNGTTPIILDILKEKNIPATFFYIGGKIGVGSADPAIIERTIEEGHSIAIHTFSHNYGELYPGRVARPAAILADRERARAAIRKVLGDDFETSAYRYPGGHMSWRSMEPADKALAKENVYWLDWNTLNGDAEPAGRAPTTVSESQAMVQANLGYPPANVAVVLMHDTGGPHSLTVQALPGIIDELLEAGYLFGVIA